MDKKGIDKEAIIEKYLMGETTYRKLEKKHGIDFRLFIATTKSFNNVFV